MTRALLALALFLSLTSSVLAYTSPGSPTGFVNDFAGVLSFEAKQNLESELQAFSATTSNEIAVVVVGTIGDDYIESYATALFEDWKIGTSKNDNGVLLLVATEDRQMRIEVGYGLEGSLPDSVAQRIIEDMIPHLRESDYDAAVQSAVQGIIAATRGEYQASPPSDFNFDQLMPLAVFGLVALQWLLAIVARTKSWWLGGVLGVGVGAGVASIFGLWLLTGLGITFGLMLFGLFFDYVVSSAYKQSKAQGTTPPWWTGGSGTGFGGSGRGGGFGGFGGGRSGGGGASGRW